jgi:hypothetical protein
VNGETELLFLPARGICVTPEAASFRENPQALSGQTLMDRQEDRCNDAPCATHQARCRTVPGRPATSRRSPASSTTPSRRACSARAKRLAQLLHAHGVTALEAI